MTKNCMLHWLFLQIKKTAISNHLHPWNKTSKMDQDIRYAMSKAGFGEEISLRPHQRKVIEGYISGSDVFLVSGTGSGKSLCYEVAPFLFDRIGNMNSIVLVVSPLVALMRLQTKILVEKNVPAVYLGDTSAPDSDGGGCQLEDIEAGKVSKF